MVGSSKAINEKLVTFSMKETCNGSAKDLIPFWFFLKKQLTKLKQMRYNGILQ